MKRVILSIAAVLAVLMIAGHASAKLMRPAKKYDTTVSGTVSVERMNGRQVYYLTDEESNRVYTLGNRNGELSQELIGILDEAIEKEVTVRIEGELSIWKDRVLSLEIRGVQYDPE